MSWYVHPSKQLRDDELPPELVVTNRNGSITQVYEPFRGECHVRDYEDTGYCVCSECGAVLPDDYTVYYCWNCGRKVVEE